MEECIKLAKYLCINNINISFWPTNKLEEFGIPIKPKGSYSYRKACSYNYGGYPNQRHDIERITIGNGGVGYYVADQSHHGTRLYSEKMGYINATASFILELKGELLKLAHKKALVIQTIALLITLISLCFTSYYNCQTEKFLKEKQEIIDNDK